MMPGRMIGDEFVEGYIRVYYEDEKRLNQGVQNAINEATAEIKKLMSSVQKAMHAQGNFSLDELFDSVATCLYDIPSYASTERSDIKELQVIVDDLVAICSFIQTLVTAIQQKVQVQENSDAIQELNENGGNYSDLTAIIQKSIGDNGKVGDTLHGLRLVLNDLMIKYNQQANNAEVDQGDPNKRMEAAFVEFFGWGLHARRSRSE